MSELIYQDEKGLHELDSHKVKLSGIPEIAFKEQRMADLLPRDDVHGLEDAVKLVEGVVKGRITKPVLLVGQPGLGKTHVARAAGIMALHLGKLVAYYKIADLLDKLRSGYDTSKKPLLERCGDEQPIEVIMRWVKDVAWLLIIDDVGLEKATDWTAEKLDQIIDARYENNKAVIMTANSLEISPRILDRCKEGGVIHIKGVSYRGLKR